jgi:hypothetical protein
VAVDRYKGVVLHDELVDWTRPDLDADALTSIFIGPCGYWDEPEFAGMGPHEIEKEILLSGGRDQWHQESPYGKPYYQHFLTLMKVLFPQTDITNTIADATMFFCLGLGFKKILNLIGCQNAGKSAGGVRILFVCMYIDPRNTVGYVANPFDNAADSTVWGDVEELWDELCEAWPHPEGREAPSLFPNGVKYASRSLVFIPKVPKAGHISLRHVKHTGKLKGTKTKGKATDRGVLFVLVDEINEIDSHAFLTTLENVSSQDAFFAITSQNFKDEEDMGGQITSPVPVFGGPATFDELGIDTDFHWHSAKASITLRFDGHRAPNILAGRTIYPYLLKQKDLDRLLESGGGEQSLIYYSQARSFPVRGGDLNTVLSKPKTSASRHLDPHYQLLELKGKVSFCDPAFGGRDAAVYGYCEFGLAAVTDGAGETFEQELMIFRDKMKKLKLVKDAVYDDFWLERMAAAGVDTAQFFRGSEVSPEDQIALQCREENNRLGITAANFGFDFSMRPDIVSSVNRIIGFEATAFDYNQGPEGCYLHGVKKESEDYCHDRVTELAFLAADVFLTKQLRGGEHIEPAIVQLQRTYHEAKGKKRKAEKKAEFKARWQGRSPDERDVLMGLNGLAAKRGFRQEGLKAPAGGGSVFSEINSRNIGKNRVKPSLN